MEATSLELFWLKEYSRGSRDKRAINVYERFNPPKAVKKKAPKPAKKIVVKKKATKKA